MTNELQKRIEGLPKWAQEHIADLVRQREEAVRTLDQFKDEQTPQPFYTEEYVCESKGAPTLRRRYINAHSITFENDGLTVHLTMYPGYLSLQYGAGTRGFGGDILMQPVSFQQLKLVYPNGKER